MASAVTRASAAKQGGLSGRQPSRSRSRAPGRRGRTAARTCSVSGSVQCRSSTTIAAGPSAAAASSVSAAAAIMRRPRLAGSSAAQSRLRPGRSRRAASASPSCPTRAGSGPASPASATPRIRRSSGRSGWNGASSRQRVHRVSRTATSGGSRASASRISREFPVPASPTSAIASPSVAIARRAAVASASSSNARPTKGESGRSTGMSRRVTDGSAASRRNIATGSANPLSAWAPSGLVVTRPEARATVEALVQTVPGAASVWMRLARCSASPATAIDCGDSSGFTTTSPEWTPTRNDWPGSTEATAPCIASAAQQPASAWSSSAIGAPNTAISSSPADFSTRPP